MDPQAPHHRAAEHPAPHGPRATSSTAPAGQQAATKNPERQDLTAADNPGIRLGAGTPWTTPVGGPAVLWRIYFDIGTAALELAEFIAEQCARRGVSAEIKAVDEYTGHAELIDVHGVVLVFASEPPGSSRPGNTPLLAQIAREFRDVRQVTAVDGFYPGSDRWHRVGVLEVCYTDHALDDPACLAIIDDACARHSYTPGVPFTGDMFEVFEPGKAQEVRENDQLAAAHDVMWKQLRRWGIDTVERARIIRRETESGVDALERPSKKAMYRPIPGVDHNQL